MKLSELLAFAIKSRASELHVAVDSPMELRVKGEVRQLNLAPLHAKAFEELVAQNLSAAARETLRTSGRCEESIEVKGLGTFRALVEGQKARFIMPAAASPAQGAAPGSVPTLGERLRGMFGRK